MTARPQLIGASRAKDSLDNTLHSMVCADQITLAGAQRAIRTNWAAAYRLYVMPPAAPSMAPAPAPAPSPSAEPPQGLLVLPAHQWWKML